MLVLHNARVATMTGSQAAAEEGPLGIIENGAVVCDGDRIVYVGRAASAPPGEPIIDAQGALLTPGLIDPHTHLIFAGDRAHEHALRLAGKTYLQIAQAGGGIQTTVKATRDASDEHLLAGLRERLSRMVRAGVTTVEVKTGYGLSVEQELRLLRLARAAGRGAGCEVAVTLLALHAVPPGARGCDAFFEKGAFDAQECRAALEAGAQAGLVPHLHADQLTASGGAQLAADLECASADHLERITQPGIEALARAGTAAVLLPLSAWFLRDPHPAQARPLIEAEVTVALGSNVNPGSQRIESPSFLLAAGCLIAGLTPAQALWACTAGAARALRMDDRGVLKRGARADLVLFATKDPAHLPYHAGVEHARLVVHGGEIVHDARNEVLHCG